MPVGLEHPCQAEKGCSAIRHWAGGFSPWASFGGKAWGLPSHLGCGDPCTCSYHLGLVTMEVLSPKLFSPEAALCSPKLQVCRCCIQESRLVSRASGARQSGSSKWGIPSSGSWSGAGVALPGHSHRLQVLRFLQQDGRAGGSLSAATIQLEQ